MALNEVPTHDNAGQRRLFSQSFDALAWACVKEGLQGLIPQGKVISASNDLWAVETLDEPPSFLSLKVSAAGFCLLLAAMALFGERHFTSFPTTDNQALNDVLKVGEAVMDSWPSSICKVWYSGRKAQTQT
ncbi:hypothetical protein EG329_010511 [Mollisiaceae sp. DMI_Dod_QoI]|nr:hypothetical protein EG329_010511 [Helotiales sp. DMI_Dod_QoI]